MSRAGGSAGQVGSFAFLHDIMFTHAMQRTIRLQLHASSDQMAALAETYRQFTVDQASSLTR